MAYDPDKLTTITGPDDVDQTGFERRGFLKRLSAATGTLVLAPSLAGWLGGSDDEGDAPDEDLNIPDELTLARAGDADLLDPHQTTYVYSSDIMNLLYDPLMMQDGEGNVTECLGKEWEISDDGLEWTTELNVDQGIEFHNGDPFTADDVVFTFNRLREDSLSAWTAGSLNNVEEIDEETVTFTFDEPYAAFNRHMTVRRYLGVLPRGPVEDDPEAFGRNPIGTGPYMMEEWVEGDHITLVRNPEYGNVPQYPMVESDDPPLPERLTFQVIPEDLPRIEGLLSGQIDMIVDDFPIHELNTVEESGDAHVMSGLSNRSTFVDFHTQLHPTDDVNVRRALTHAINKEQIIDDIFMGQGSKNWVPLSENIFGWAGDTVRDEVGYEYDVDRANELLEEAGWEMNGNFREQDGETLTLDMVAENAPSAHVQAAEEIMAMWNDIGVDVNMTTYESTTAYQQMTDGEYNVMGFAQIRWEDPDVFSFMWDSNFIGATNRTFYDNPEADELLTEGQQTIDDAGREQVYEDLQVLVMEDCPCAPLFTEEMIIGVHDRVQNAQLHPDMNYILYHDIQLSD